MCDGSLSIGAVQSRSVLSSAGKEKYYGVISCIGGVRVGIVSFGKMWFRRCVGTSRGITRGVVSVTQVDITSYNVLVQVRLFVELARIGSVRVGLGHDPSGQVRFWRRNVWLR